MATLVLHPDYIPAKYIGTERKKGKTYYRVRWDNFGVNYIGEYHSPTHLLPADKCRLKITNRFTRGVARTLKFISDIPGRIRRLKLR